MGMTSAAEAWDSFTESQSKGQLGLHWWQSGPTLQEYINFKCSGDSQVTWYEHAINKYFTDRLPLEYCLSLGCGSGYLERRLSKLNVFSNCDACDISEGSIKEAKKVAMESDIHSINYFIADVNSIELPIGKYDAVWISGALHHFEALEYVCKQINQSLKPDGLLILNEYIGPNRFQFSERQKELVNHTMKLIPEKYRVRISAGTDNELQRTPLNQGLKWTIQRIGSKIRDRDLMDVIKRRIKAYKALKSGNPDIISEVNFPSMRDIINADPSESVRSEEIINVVQQEFSIIEKNDWGGNIFQFVLEGIAGNFATGDQEAKMIMNMITNIEDTLLKSKELTSDYAYIVAKPK